MLESDEMGRAATWLLSGHRECRVVSAQPQRRFCSPPWISQRFLPASLSRQDQDLAAWDSPGPASISFPRSSRGTHARYPTPPCLLEPSFGSPSLASFLPLTHSSQATHFYLAHVFQGFLPLHPQVGKRFLSIVLTFIYLTRKRNCTAHFQGFLT